MTIADMFVRATRPLSSKVPGSMSAEHQQYLVDAANKALNDYTRKLPSLRLQEPHSERLVASFSKSITASSGSKTIAFSPSWTEVSSHLGRTVLVAGDASRTNRLASATSLVQAYEGQTGATTVEVLSDAVMIGQSYEVAGDVVLVDNSDTWPLVYGMPNGQYPGRWRSTMGMVGGAAETVAHQIVRARPTNWWIENLNGLTGEATPSFVLRLWPQPDKLYQINFALRLWPTALTVDDLDSTVVLPLQVNEEATFMDLVYPGLFTCPLWQGTAVKDDYQNAAAAALRALGGDEQNRGHQQPSLCGTKRGF
jgi:hypothetical protein